MTAKRIRTGLPLHVAILAPCLALLSCSEQNQFVPPPPPPVGVQPPLVQDHTVYKSYPARTEPFQKYEVRARVTGFLEKMDFKDGQFVTPDKELFFIEKVQLEAEKEKALGEHEKAIGNTELAKITFEKKKRASEKGAIAGIEVDEAKNAWEVAKADVRIKKAALDEAEANLGYATINSPIKGRISRSLVDRGNVVSASQSTLLATVVQDDPILVTFRVDEREILQYLEKRPSEADPIARGKIEKKPSLRFSDTKLYGEIGTFNSLDNEVDPDTGTIEVSAEFPNPDRKLAAGLSVKIEIPELIKDAVFIPAAVVQRDVGGDFVFVLKAGSKNIVERRNIKLTEFIVGDLVIVAENLGSEDRIVVDNLQRVRPGAPVNPTALAAPVLPAEEGTKPGDSSVKPGSGQGDVPAGSGGAQE